MKTLVFGNPTSCATSHRRLITLADIEQASKDAVPIDQPVNNAHTGSLIGFAQLRRESPPPDFIHVDIAITHVCHKTWFGIGDELLPRLERLPKPLMCISCPTEKRHGAERESIENLSILFELIPVCPAQTCILAPQVIALNRIGNGDHGDG